MIKANEAHKRSSSKIGEEKNAIAEIESQIAKACECGHFAIAYEGELSIEDQKVLLDAGYEIFSIYEEIYCISWKHLDDFEDDEEEEIFDDVEEEPAIIQFYLDNLAYDYENEREEELSYAEEEEELSYAEEEEEFKITLREDLLLNMRLRIVVSAWKYSDGTPWISATLSPFISYEDPTNEESDD